MGQLNASGALHEANNPTTLWRAGWVGPRASLDKCEAEKSVYTVIQTLDCPGCT